VLGFDPRLTRSIKSEYPANPTFVKVQPSNVLSFTKIAPITRSRSDDISHSTASRSPATLFSTRSNFPSIRSPARPFRRQLVN